MSSPAGPLEVLFIAGSTRSGSTVIDRLIGSCPGAVSTGELEAIWRTATRTNWLCSCGRRVADCEFWRAVLERAYGSFDAIPLERFRALQNRFAGNEGLLRALAPVHGDAYLRERSEFGDVLSRLYNAIAEVAGARTIVDSTKNSAYGLVLASRPDFRLAVLHLVRDSRAVAFSWTRDRSSASQVMGRRPVLLSAWRWNRENVAAEILRARVRRSLRLRYEDFARDPSAAFATLSQRLGTPAPELAEGRVGELKPGHLVRGNPMRFDVGPVQIREDDEWKTALPTRNRLGVTLLTWPLLLRYGYSPW